MLTGDWVRCSWCRRDCYKTPCIRSYHKIDGFGCTIKALFTFPFMFRVWSVFQMVYYLLHTPQRKLEFAKNHLAQKLKFGETSWMVLYLAGCLTKESFWALKCRKCIGQPYFGLKFSIYLEQWRWKGLNWWPLGHRGFDSISRTNYPKSLNY